MAKTHIPDEALTWRASMYSRDRYMGEYRWMNGIESIVNRIAVPGYIEADFLPPKDGTGVLITIKVDDGDPRATAVEFYSDSEEVAIPPTAISWVAKNLDRIVTGALLNTSARLQPDASSTPEAFTQGQAFDPSVEAAAYSITGLAKRRRSDDLDHLKTVAGIYNANPAEPRRAVMRQLFFSARTTDRRIAAARDRGFIPTSTKEEEK